MSGVLLGKGIRALPHGNSLLIKNFSWNLHLYVIVMWSSWTLYRLGIRSQTFVVSSSNSRLSFKSWQNYTLSSNLRCLPLFTCDKIFNYTLFTFLEAVDQNTFFVIFSKILCLVNAIGVLSHHHLIWYYQILNAFLYLNNKFYTIKSYMYTYKLCCKMNMNVTYVRLYTRVFCITNELLCKSNTQRKINLKLKWRWHFC